MIVKYRTIKSDSGVLSDKLLKEIGLEGWHLGGVAQTTESIMGFGPEIVGKRDVFYYHFWKEVMVR